MVKASPPPTEFEVGLSKCVAEIVKEGMAGYRWSAADDFVAALDLPDTGRRYVTRFKRAGGASRGANVLKESPQMTATVYFLVLMGDYSPSSLLETVVPDMRRNRKQVGAIAVITQGSDGWRVRSIVAQAADETLVKLRHYFPAAASNILVLESSASSVITRTTPTDESLSSCLTLFEGVVAERGLVVDRAAALDLLACALSSQFLLFAGPSGTGKSMSARLLADFFSTDASIGVLESRRQWIGPEDVVGYFSPITGEFVRTPHSATISRLSVPPDEELDVNGAYPVSPFLIVEEANLSAIDGYLSPIVHGLSSPSTPLVEWALAAPGQKDDEESKGEAAMSLGPFMRVLGTINVDASAPAPARKVSARAAVILVEPVPLQEASTVVKILDGLGTPHESEGGAGRSLMQDPVAILGVTSASRKSEAVESFRAALQLLPDSVVVSHRDVHRSLLYMLWYVGLGSGVAASLGGESALRSIAAENALLHFVLPSLGPAAFQDSVRALVGSDALRPKEAPGIGGLLRPRLERLLQSLNEAEGFSGAIDFWNALS